jgi:hypothetical protein
MAYMDRPPTRGITLAMYYVQFHAPYIQNNNNIIMAMFGSTKLSLSAKV